MKKILVLFTLILGFFAFASADVPIGLAAAAQAGAPTMESCEAVCRSCQTVCEKTLAYCQKKGGKHTEATHLNTLKDCITACKTSADFLDRKSANHMKSCALCAEICRICAASCEAFADDKQMQDCAGECRKCAESCEKMSKMK